MSYDSDSSEFEELLTPDEASSFAGSTGRASPPPRFPPHRSEPQGKHGGRQPPWKGHGDNLVGVVDMGSNGIRFSITDLSPPLTRILPTVWVDRSKISLYDAQFDEDGKQVPIPASVIKSVCNALLRFKIICDDFECRPENIHVLATEATRLAKNSEELLTAVKETTGFTVQLLDKEMEGQVGALGVASGFSNMEGLFMDLGGGSTQISWIVSQGGYVRTSPKGSVSFPWGAAALTKKLAELDEGKDKDEAKRARQEFKEEMQAKLRQAYDSLQVPDVLVEEARQEKGFRIYLSGGGFRGYGYVHLYLNQTPKHDRKRPYPISIINGYVIDGEQFRDTEKVKEVAKAADELFRVSDRRRVQLPAVAFLVNALAEAIPLGIKEAHFCQGGVREGWLYRQIPPSVRAQAPLEVATRQYVNGTRKGIQQLLESAIPPDSSDGHKRFPPTFGHEVLDAFANVMYVHMFMSKETASTTALYTTSTGMLSSTHGVSHQDRARLALMLQARYRGELPPREVVFREALRDILSDEDVWWSQYLGRVGYLITCLYPTGKIHHSKPKVLMTADYSSTMGKKKKKNGLILTISLQKVENDGDNFRKTIHDNVKKIEKAGKKKNWTNGWGMKVEVRVAEEKIM